MSKRIDKVLEQVKEYNKGRIIYIEKSNILDATEDAIAHQCNCITRGYGRGLATAIFRKFPYSNFYRSRHRNDNPGNIIVRDGFGKYKMVIGMLAQYGPGKSEVDKDTKEDRLRWFTVCLEKISKLNIKSIAFPFHIGCGLAGGNWKEYEELLINWANEHPQIQIVIHHITNFKN
jgi:O-acetyl-ADP-ribose deacetylase (regulator of RNase III)